MLQDLLLESKLKRLLPLLFVQADEEAPPPRRPTWSLCSSLCFPPPAPPSGGFQIRGSAGEETRTRTKETRSQGATGEEEA